MPCDWKKYPPNWKALARAVKDAADWKCQRPECGKQCRRPGEPFDTHKRTLTVAHLNHVEADCRPENLMALCAPCHLRYDAPAKAARRVALRVNGKMTGGTCEYPGVVRLDKAPAKGKVTIEYVAAAFGVPLSALEAADPRGEKYAMFISTFKTKGVNIMDEKIIHLTPDEAIQIMKVEDGTVHCFIPAGPTLLGADWDVGAIRELLNRTTHPDHIQIAGENAKSFGHAVGVFDPIHRHYCFFATDADAVKCMEVAKL